MHFRRDEPLCEIHVIAVANHYNMFLYVVAHEYIVFTEFSVYYFQNRKTDLPI